MIQSGKFDSSIMDIKKIANTLLIFIIKKLIEIMGILVSIFGIFIFISLISYSPNDPNFIFPENVEIENFFGFQGSYLSDLFFQSVGLIAYLVPITYFFTGINIFNKKKISLIITNTFFIVPYSLTGSIFFSFFYKNNFILHINGSGGFVGNYLNESLLENLIRSYENIFYYSIIFLTIILFLFSINFNLKNFILFLKKITQKIFSKNDQNYTNKNELINEYIPQDDIKNLIQEDLPFIKADNFLSNKKTKIKLPSIDLLKKNLILLLKKILKVIQIKMK